jgi:hypothetical protein
MAKITFEDKVATRQSLLPAINTISAADINEIKTSVNSLHDDAVWTFELIGVLTLDLYSPSNVKIISTEKRDSGAVITIDVDDIVYVPDATIDQYSKITVSSDIATIVKLYVQEQ